MVMTKELIDEILRGIGLEKIEIEPDEKRDTLSKDS